MTDDDIAEMLAADFGVEPRPDVLDTIKSTRHFKSVKAQLALTELGVQIEQSAPRWLRRFIDRLSRFGRQDSP